MHKTNAIRIIEQKKIPYEESSFPWSKEHVDAASAAQALGAEAGSVYKTLVTIGSIGPIVAVIPGNLELDLKALAKASGTKRLEMLPLKDLEKTTGYIRGGCSPIGMKKAYPTFLAQEAQTKKAIYVSAGKRGRQVKVAPDDLATIVQGRFADITEKNNSV